jgi:hypothetical protein
LEVEWESNVFEAVKLEFPLKLNARRSLENLDFPFWGVVCGSGSISDFDRGEGLLVFRWCSEAVDEEEIEEGTEEREEGTEE